MDLSMLFQMFLIFTTEIIVSSIMLFKHPLRFRFKAYISVPVGLLIAYGAAVGVVLGLYFWCKPENWNEFVNILVYFICVAGVYFALFFTYKITIPQLTLLLSVAYTFQHMAYQWATLILDTGLQGEWYKAMGPEAYQAYQPILYNICNYTIRIGIYAGCYFLIARPYKKYSKYIIRTLNIIVLGVLLFLVVNVANVYVVQHIWWDNKLRAVLAITLIIFCILFDTLVVGGFRVMEHRQETIIIKATLNSKIRQQEMVENNINFINMKCHDLRKELRRLKEKKGNLTDEDFCLLEESLNFYDSSVKTGNVNIDALIQEKLIYCNSVGIEFTSLVNGEAFEEMASSDIYFLLVNIIDNAIEAAESFEEKEKRVISLTASKKQGFLFIEETNYYQGKVSFNKDGSIITTKENKKYHGYGTKSIAYIVKKYDGKVEYEVKDNIFKLKIVI